MNKRADERKDENRISKIDRFVVRIAIAYIYAPHRNVSRRFNDNKANRPICRSTSLTSMSRSKNFERFVRFPPCWNSPFLRTRNNIHLIQATVGESWRWLDSTDTGVTTTNYIACTNSVITIPKSLPLSATAYHYLPLPSSTTYHHRPLLTTTVTTADATSETYGRLSWMKPTCDPRDRSCRTRNF